MNRPLPSARTLALHGLAVLLLAGFVWVVVLSGFLAPVAVTVATVDTRTLTPALFGIGNVEARYTYKIGPTAAGRLQRLDVHVGDRVKAGQVLGTMDPIDFDARIRSQDAVLRRAAAALREAQARQAYGQAQAERYAQLGAVHMVSAEVSAAKRQEGDVADAALDAAREELARARAERSALQAQRSNLLLVAPVDGLVTTRAADPGTTLVAGQAAVEVIDPATLWLNVRFDQVNAAGLAAGLAARIQLRSRGGQTLSGHVLRVEPVADTVTEETLAKVQLDVALDPPPPIGELAEVTVLLPALPPAPSMPNAAVRRLQHATGVWKVRAGTLRFTPVTLGAADLDGLVQVRAGLTPGDQVVVHAERALGSHDRIRMMDRLPGVQP
jgi:RND family efflux transporter MFP subunit